MAKRITEEELRLNITVALHAAGGLPCNKAEQSMIQKRPQPRKSHGLKI